MSKQSAASDRRTVRIPAAVFRETCLHAAEQLPLEACGYLAGRGLRVEKCFRMRNADESREHFAFDAEEQFAVAEEAGKAGLSLIAVYHSHPASPPRPSAEDVRLAYDPEIIHVIISMTAEEPVARAFRIEDGAVEELDLMVGP